MEEELDTLRRRIKKLERSNRILTAKLERSEENRRRLEELKERHGTLQRTIISELRAAQEQVRRANEELGRRVDERTRALRSANAALIEARDAALAANQAKSYFLATMSHELRTPLNVIIGYAELLQELVADGLLDDGAPDRGVLSISGDDLEAMRALRSALTRRARVIDNDAAQEDLDRILRAARHLLTLIDDILDLSKIEAGASELQLAPVDLARFFAEMADTARTLANKQRNKFSLTLAALPDDFVTDRTKLRQIVNNLLSNAAKFTRDGELELSARCVAQRLLISVRDSGIGIAREDFSKLFKPFSQVEAAANRRFEGSGLGLALVRKHCQLLGGEVDVESELGVGSTFTVTLPIAIERAAGEQRAG